MQEVTEQFKQWLEAEPEAPFSHFSHAAHALMTDVAAVQALNAKVRAEKTEWIDGTTGWPADEWIIGEDGRGDLYLVSSSGKYEGVAYYDHETRTIEPFQPSLRAFYDYCLKVDGSGERVRAQLRESLVTYVEEKLNFKPTKKTRFFWDTKVGEADAAAFMNDLAKDFEVDLSTFEGKRYGIVQRPSSGGILGLISKLKGHGPDHLHFTIEHLVDVLQQKKWSDPTR